MIQAAAPQPAIHILVTPRWKDYALLDSGNGSRLERFGIYRLTRPEAEAIWRPALPVREWNNVHAVFMPAPEENGGHWKLLQALPERWVMDYRGLRFYAQTSASRHVGLFPEQASHWDWIEQQVVRAKQIIQPVRVLNLFGYTGIASLAAARAGAQVTHLDASRKVVTWARENQALSGLEQRTIRWIIDDALKFVQREARRGSTYEGLILDPPKFGRGPKGEVWEFYKLIPELLSACRQILSPQVQFVVITAYAVKASAITLFTALEAMLQGRQGFCEAGELVLQDESAGRLLSTAIFARWCSAAG